jgi:hypothetical protein
MTENTEKSRSVKYGLLGLLMLSVLAFRPVRALWIEFSLSVPGNRYRLLQWLGWAALALLFLLALYAWLGGAGRIWYVIEGGGRLFTKVWVLALPVFVLLLAAYPLLLHGRYYFYFASIFARYWLLVVFILAGAFLLKVWRDSQSWAMSLLVSCIAFGVAYLVATFVPAVSTYPFSLSWSETSRFYHGSLWLDKYVYSLDLPLPHRDFSRYLMQAVPFLVPNSPLWLHRFWETAMRLLLPVLAAWLLARRIGIEKRSQRWLFSLWGLLFLRQGPVFYQMLAVVIPMVWWFDSRKVWRSTVLVILVSVWAGITRVNWFPVPGLMAAMLYIMEQPLSIKNAKEWLRYPMWPLAWTAGGSVVAWSSQNYYQAHSGLPMHMFATAYSADMLWYRLLPNVNFSWGVLTGTLIVCAPLLVYVFSGLRGWGRRWHPLRLLGVWGIILGLFAGSLVVSVKIGGGANLHNMDTFMVVLLLLAAYLYGGRFVEDDGLSKGFRPAPLLLGAIVFMPLLFHVVQYSEPFPQRNFEAAWATLEELQDYVDEYEDAPGEILFVAERHLLTFHYIKNVPLVHDYEKIVLMEMALGNDQQYLDEFYRDLKNHRFSLIVTDIISDRYKEPQQFVFAEENNVHAERVVAPLECEYRPIDRLKVAGVQLWVPRSKSQCP